MNPDAPASHPRSPFRGTFRKYVVFSERGNHGKSIKAVQKKMERQTAASP